MAAMLGDGAQTTLGSLLRAAFEDRLSWHVSLFLPQSAALALDTPCLLLEWRDDEAEVPLAAAAQGFPVAGPSAERIIDAAQWTANLTPAPSDAVLLESYRYYAAFDAFLPAIGAPPPPSAEECQRNMDREFYHALGPERHDTPCRHDGCGRGAIRHGIFCKPHHFASVQRRLCPFSD